MSDKIIQDKTRCKMSKQDDMGWEVWDIMICDMSKIEFD